MTRAQITNLVGDASEAGVRKVLSRLVVQGIVIEERIGSRYAYRANRDQLLWPAVEIVTSAPRALEDRIRAEIATWETAPLSIELFGSVARGASDAESDVDLVVVSPVLEDSEQEMWDERIDDLRDKVQAWTGNVCDITVLDPPELVAAKRDNVPALRSDRVSVAGPKLDDVLERLESTKQFAELSRRLSEQVRAAYAQNPALLEFQRSAAKMAAAAATPAMADLQATVRKIVQQQNASMRRSAEAVLAAQRVANQHSHRES